MPRLYFKPHSHQREALTSKARYVALISGVQGGKTTCGAYWLAMQVLRDKTKDYLVVFPTYKIGQQSTMKKFKSLFPKWGKFVQRDMVYNLSDGGHIYFRSAEDPTALEGITASACWIDEAGQISALAWETVQARLSIAKGKCLLTTTPYAMNWLYHNFYKKWEAGDKDYHVVQFRSMDSPYFPKDEYDRVKNTLDGRRFKLKYEGQFTQMEGLVYSGFNRQKHVVRPYRIPKDAEIVCGMDFGTNDPTVVLWAYKDDKDNIIVFKEYYKTKQTIKQIAPHLRLYKPKVIYADPSGKGFINELQQTYGITNLTKADNSLDEGIARLQSLFNMDKIKIFSTCVNLMDELEMYRYKDNRDGMLTDKPEDKNNHATDSLRYLVRSGMARPSLKLNYRMHPLMSGGEEEEVEWSYGDG